MKTFKSMLVVLATLIPIEALAKDHQVVIRDFGFSPAALTIAEGDTVTWVNEDRAPHTATGNGFDTGRLRKGKSATIKFTAAGAYAYICAIHPRMKAAITVK